MIGDKYSHYYYLFALMYSLSKHSIKNMKGKLEINIGSAVNLISEPAAVYHSGFTFPRSFFSALSL